MLRAKTGERYNYSWMISIARQGFLRVLAVKSPAKLRFFLVWPKCFSIIIYGPIISHVLMCAKRAAMRVSTNKKSAARSFDDGEGRLFYNSCALTFSNLTVFQSTFWHRVFSHSHEGVRSWANDLHFLCATSLRLTAHSFMLREIVRSRCCCIRTYRTCRLSRNKFGGYDIS